MPRLPPELQNIGLENLDGTAPPVSDTVEWADYGNALQVGTGQAAAAVNRGGEYISNKLDATGAEQGFAEGARKLEAFSQEQREGYSPAAQAALSTEFATTDTDKAAWAVWKNGLAPITLRMTESAPNMVATIGPLGAAARMGMSAVGLAGIEGLLSGALSGAYIAGDIAKEVEALTPEQLTQVQGYQDYKDAGYSDDDIRSEIKELLQTDTVSGGAAAVGASGAVAGPLLGPLFKGGSKLAPRTGRAMAIEAPQEAFEEFTEGVATNIGIGDPALQGALENALAGAFVGGPTAGVVVAATGGKTRKQRVIEEGYKSAYKSGDPEQIELYRAGVTMVMGEAEATKFFKEVEADAEQEIAVERAKVVTPDQEEALKAHEEKAAPPVVETPDVAEGVDVATALATAAEKEAAAEAETGAALDAEAEAEASPIFTGTGLDHLQEVWDVSIDDTSTNATIGKAVTTPAGKPSKRKVRTVKERALALGGMVDDIQEAIKTLKQDGYNTAELERVIAALARGKAGLPASDNIVRRFKGRSGDGVYQSPYAGGKALGGNKAIDQFLKDLQSAREEMIAAGQQEVIGETTPTPEPVKTIKAQITALQNGTKAAVLVTPGTRVKKSDYEGFSRKRLPNGKGSLIYKDPATLKAAQAWAKDEAAHPEFAANILNYGVGTKPATSKVTTARDSAGTVVQDVVGTDENIQAAAEEVAGEGGTVEVREAEEAVAERAEEVAKETRSDKAKKVSADKSKRESKPKPTVSTKPKATQPKAETSKKKVAAKPYAKMEGKDVKLKQKADNGKMVTLTVDAAVLMRDYDKRIDSLQKLVKACA